MFDRSVIGGLNLDAGGGNGNGGVALERGLGSLSTIRSRYFFENKIK